MRERFFRARAPARARGDAGSTRGRPARRSVRASAIDPQPPSEPESGIPRGSTIPRSMGSRRRWEAAASSEVNVGIGAALPALVPWAEDRVAKWATAWEKAAALSPNMPISVMDLTPESSTHPEQEQRKLGPFETDFGAFIYDKGYRQLFRALGYPGADAEAAPRSTGSIPPPRVASAWTSPADPASSPVASPSDSAATTHSSPPMSATR